MRIKLLFTKNTQEVPNNQNIVNSYIHKCLGKDNKYHDTPSNYSISRLLGGEIINGGKNVDFKNGGYIIISSLDLNFLNKIILGILVNTDLGFGMKLNSIDHITEKFFNGWNYFKTTNMGFLLRKNVNKTKKIDYYTLNDPDISIVLKEHIINKFSKINPELDFKDFNVVIDKHPTHKVKRVYSKNVKNITNICQLNIYTNKKVAEYIYNYGIGQSTGSGFGTVYTTRKRDLYK